MSAIAPRIACVSLLLAFADRMMRDGAEDDDGQARSLANDLTWLRNRFTERLEKEAAAQAALERGLVPQVGEPG